MNRKTRIFYSYAHEDRDLCEDVKKHLVLLQQEGVIESWFDRDIAAGADWEAEIQKRLEEADVILLLISVDFLASDYCRLEAGRALERARRGEAVVVPVILRPVDWASTPYHQLQCLPSEARPVVKWGNRDEAFVDVAHGIRRIVMLLRVEGLPVVEGSPGPAAPELIAAQQDRILDAAMTPKVPMGKPADLAVMVRRTDSAGLRAVLEVDDEYSGKPEDVRSKPFRLEFPRDEIGRLTATTLTLKLESPDFDPPTQTKQLSVPPDRDSDICTFLLTPLFVGELVVNLEVYAQAGRQASRVFRIQAEASDRVLVRGRMLVSVPISTVAARPAQPGPGESTRTMGAPPPAAKPVAAGAVLPGPVPVPSRSEADTRLYAEAKSRYVGVGAQSAPAPIPAQRRRSMAKPFAAAAAVAGVLVCGSTLYYATRPGASLPLSASLPPTATPVEGAPVAASLPVEMAEQAIAPPQPSPQPPVAVGATNDSAEPWQLAYGQGIRALSTDPAEAAKQFEAAQQAAPAEPTPAAALAGARLEMALRATGDERQRLLSQAAVASQMAVTLAPSATNYLTQGVALQRGGKLAEAEAALRRATELDSAQPEAWYALGVVLNDAGKPDEAAAALEKAVQLDARNDSARLLLAAVLARKNPIEARKHAAILMDDTNVTVKRRDAARRLAIELKK